MDRERRAVSFFALHRDGAVVGVNGVLHDAGAEARAADFGAFRLVAEKLQADALRLPFSDGTFDVITVGYGLRNLADPEAGIAEIRRLLAPGGRAVILDFGKPENPIAASLYGAFLNTMMPAVGPCTRTLPSRSRATSMGERA